MELLIVIIFLLCFIVFLEIKNYFERRALTNKIMAKNYQEYALHELEHVNLKQRGNSKVDQELMNL
jgi:hypothetical protein